MEVPKWSGSGLRIILEEQPQNTLITNLHNTFNTFAPTIDAPTSISDFNCFAVNVTGEGIQSNPDALSDCSSTDNFAGVGVGIVSKGLFSRGQSITLDIPAGPKRNIDVYGIYPPANDCPGGASGASGSSSDSGYFLGRATRDLSEPATVVIPISYSGASATITCTEPTPNSSGSSTSMAVGTRDTSFNNGGAGFSTPAVNFILPELNTGTGNGTGSYLIVNGNSTYNGNTVPNKLVRIFSNGTADTSFNNGGAGFDGPAYAALQQVYAGSLSGSFIVGGSFTTYNGNIVPDGLMKIDSSGNHDTTFNNSGVGFDGAVYTLAQYPPSETLIAGGSFTTYNGTSANRIVRLNNSGTPDATFLTNMGTGFDGDVSTILYEKDTSNAYTGWIIVGGSFQNYNGTPYSRIIKLAYSGTINGSFNVGSGFNGQVKNIIQDMGTDGLSTGKIIVVGDFTVFNGNDIGDRVTRLDSNGTLDATFNNGGIGFGAGTVNAVVAEKNSAGNYTGKYLVAGNFSNYNGASVPANVIRLNNNGSFDPTFNNGGLGANSSITALSIDMGTSTATGKTMIGGSFTSFNGSATPGGLIRLY